MAKFRWSKVYESSEEELQTFLQSRGITAVRHDLASGEQTILRAARLWCAEGSATISNNGSTSSLQPGDGTDVTAAQTLTAGISGCVYYLG